MRRRQPAQRRQSCSTTGAEPAAARSAQCAVNGAAHAQVPSAPWGIEITCVWCADVSKRPRRPQTSYDWGTVKPRSAHAAAVA